ncbi:hypothetical protein H5410_048383 [Solanum commersonii]|uniref:Uncharacterized protein n=1 Tax=Solanum commersonii TaxID=4109 RepID=A0A9J5XJJ4_SOLCO|nr:hypothetical protein H5410_048383 [Solanum commersonii]
MSYTILKSNTEPPINQRKNMIRLCRVVKFKLVNRNISVLISLHDMIHYCYGFARRDSEFQVGMIQPG